MKKALSLVLLFVTITVQAATPQSLVGGSGLGLMRTAEVMGPGESAWILNGATSEYQSTVTPGSSALLIDAVIGYARSFGGHTEFSLLIPYGLYTPDTSSGTSYAGNRGITGVLKHSFTDPVYGQGTAFAFSLIYTLYPGQASTNITSGERLHGFEFNLSHWAQTTGFHLNLGYGLVDNWSESALPPFVATEVITASTGIEIGLSEAMTFSLQALAKTAIAAKDENLLASALFTYSISKHTVFNFGGAWGIPANRSRPNSSLIFGLSYSPQAKRQTRYEIKGSSEELQEQNQRILERVEAIDERMERLENTLIESTTPKPVKPLAIPPAAAPVEPLAQHGMAEDTTSITVELRNAGIKDSIVQSIGDTLRSAGYRVLVNPDANAKVPKRTHVFYRNGLSDEAVRLGHKLKGNQIVVKKELPEGIDIRVDLGADLAH